jgi:thiol-disulfide isomerase/thioredoxin
VGRLVGMISVGPLSLPILPLLLITGLLASLMWARRMGAARSELESVMYVIVLSAVLVARIAFVSRHWSIYAQNPSDIMDIRDGGFFPAFGVGAGFITCGWYLWRKPFLKPALLSCMLAGVTVAALGGVAAWATKVPALIALPVATFTGLDGKPVRLNDFLGKPVVVNLWASWCPPCRREMPILTLAQASNPAVVFVFANQGETAQTVRQYFAGAHVNPANVILDSQLELARLAASSVLPVTLFFDVAGKLRSLRMGKLSAATLAAELGAFTRSGGL